MKLEEEILEKIKTNEQIKRYKILEKFVNENETIKIQVTKLKELQKQIVHAKEYNKDNLLKLLEEKYKIKYDEIIKHPIVAEYIDLQNKINDMLQNFIQVVEMGINSDLTTK